MLPEGLKKPPFFLLLDENRMLLSGITCQDFSASRRDEVKVWHKIPQKDSSPDVQCPIAETKIITVLMTHFFFCAKSNEKKKRRNGDVTPIFAVSLEIE